MTIRTTPETEPRPTTDGRRVALGRLWWAAPLAAAAAALANAAVYGLAEAAGALPDRVLVGTPSGPGPLGLSAVLFSSAMAAVGAAVVFALVGRFARRPIRTFRLVAAVALVLSFATPLTLPGAPLAMVLALELMHVVAAVAIVGVLTTLTRGS